MPVVGILMALTALNVGGQVVLWENAHWTMAGLLATVPVHVPIAVGSLGPYSADDLATRASRWSGLIDLMLEHPLARAHRLSAREQS